MWTGPMIDTGYSSRFLMRSEETWGRMKPGCVGARANWSLCRFVADEDHLLRLRTWAYRPFGANIGMGPQDIPPFFVSGSWRDGCHWIMTTISPFTYRLNS